ncbi:MAG: FtsL-like putative cell division protein [Prevotellaceae bacterium]|nr:hypothetical protein [Prevotella sp.]MDD7257468.1 FtsL-like putative cell division protein [Prevotellaceae bacterium]MDY6130897.1 FtsL-like putative cell division protein [Prevotella sp.]
MDDSKTSIDELIERAVKETALEQSAEQPEALKGTSVQPDGGKTAGEQKPPKGENLSRQDPERKEGKENGEASLSAAIKKQAREDEALLTSTLTLRKIIGGDWLTADFLRRQIGLILLVVFFAIVYISNRYSCQKDLLEIDRLNAELTDAKYRALSSSSELTEKSRESNVLEMLKNNKDSVLKIASQPPYIINVPEQ